MTTINCSLNCIYQVEGRCNLDNIVMVSISSNPECIYFQEKKSKLNSVCEQNQV
ncbi:MAG: hydroxymyristoyl-ACP dehydratase [Bacillota bacterium]|nr:hydroxymyristoyl-ACP dehydratase [Bacillota bacterium]